MNDNPTNRRFLFIFLVIWIGWGLSAFQPVSPLRDEIVVKNQSFYKAGKNGNYEMNISFPRIVYSEPEVIHNVNLDIQRIMAMAIADFTEKVKKQGATVGFSSLTLDYKIHFDQADILSLQFIKHTILAGNEKPADLFLTYNYDLKKGKVILLSDLFNDREDFKSKLLSLALSQMKRCKVKTEYVLKNFCIEFDGLVLTIDDATGNGKNCLSEVTVSWESLSQLLRQDGIASLFIQKGY